MSFDSSSTGRTPESLFSQDLCKICQHPQRGEIEKQMLTPGPEASYRQVADKFGLSAMGVKRHKPHMITAINRQLAKTEDTIATKLMRDVEKQVEKLGRWGEAAALDNNYRDAAQCMAVAHKYLEMMAKLYEMTGYKQDNQKAPINAPGARFVVLPNQALPTPATPPVSGLILPAPAAALASLEDEEDILDGDPEE